MNKRILVFEDEPIIRMLVVEVLQDAGYDVLEAKDGVEAMRLIEDPDHVALIVTDINMPGPDGIEVVAKARALERLLPVIFMSGRPNFMVVQHVGQPCRYFGKPFQISDLVAAIGELLEST